MDWSGTWPDFGPDSHLLIAPNSEHSLASGIPEVAATMTALFKSVAAGEAEAQRPSFEVAVNKSTGELTVTVDGGAQRPPLEKAIFRHVGRRALFPRKFGGFDSCRRALSPQVNTLSKQRRDFRWVRASNSSWTEPCTFPGVTLKHPVAGAGNCVQPMIWSGKEIEPEAGKPLVYKVTPPAPKQEGHWVGYYVEFFFKGLTGATFKLSTPGHVWPDTFPFPACPDFAKCDIKLV